MRTFSSSYGKSYSLNLKKRSQQESENDFKFTNRSEAAFVKENALWNLKFEETKKDIEQTFTQPPFHTLPIFLSPKLPFSRLNLFENKIENLQNKVQTISPTVSDISLTSVDGNSEPKILALPLIESPEPKILTSTYLAVPKLEIDDLFEVDVLKFEPKYHDDNDKLVRHSSQLNPYLNPFEDSFSQLKPFFQSPEGKKLLVKSFNSIQFLLNEGKVSNQVLYHIQNTIIKFMKSQTIEEKDNIFDCLSEGTRFIDNVVFLSKFQKSLFSYKTRTNSMVKLFHFFDIDENDYQIFENIDKLNMKTLLKDMTVDELSVFIGSEVVSQKRISHLIEEKLINQKVYSIFAGGNEKELIKVLNSIEKYIIQNKKYAAIKIFLLEKIKFRAEEKDIVLSEEELNTFFNNIEIKVGKGGRSSHLDKLFSQFEFDGKDRSVLDVEDFLPKNHLGDWEFGKV